MNGKALSIKNDSKISFLAIEITKFIGRGSSTTEKLAATLREIKKSAGIKSLKDLKQPHVIQIVKELKNKTKSGNMSLSNANSYISSINNIVKYIGSSYLQAIKASNYELSRNISGKDGINKENTREAAAAFKTWLDEKYTKTNDLRYAALKHAVNIQSVNLRLRESLLVKLGKKDLSNNILKIATKGDGSKNSRAREIKINSEQKATLLEARLIILKISASEQFATEGILRIIPLKRLKTKPAFISIFTENAIFRRTKPINPLGRAKDT